MKSLLIELDDNMAARIERVAPGRGRRRSEFIRAAIRRALWEIEERETTEAYRRQPDMEGPYFDPNAWDVPVTSKRGQVKR